MHRRRFLALVGSGAMAGCGARSPQGETSFASEKLTTAGDADTSSTRTMAATDVLVVHPEGRSTGSGTDDDPLDSIQTALERAQPGSTIRVMPGEYVEFVHPPIGGEPGAPITITGPPDAVLRSAPGPYYVARIRRSHVHLRGLTVTGLENPDAPNSLASYSDGELIRVSPPTNTDRYLRDVVVEPARIGYSPKALVAVERTKGASIGGFRVIGPAGAKYTVGDAEPAHNGEIVYLGTAPGNLGSDWHPWTDYDRTSDVRIHHIDNSEGHPHSELVNTKLGTHDVLVEYCTDGGGSQNRERYLPSSIALQSYGATVRWCVLQGGTGRGISVGSWNARDARERKPTGELTDAERYGGTENAIYGNRITGFPGGAFSFPYANAGQTPAAQRLFCGNEYDGPVPDTPGDRCPGTVPEGDGIGHTGGDSP